MGQWVAAGNHGGFGVRVWDAHTGKVLHHLIPDAQAADIAFSPDGRLLVTASATAFDIWETDSWKLARHLGREQGSENPGTAAFTPDGKVLAITLSPSVVQWLPPRTAPHTQASAASASAGSHDPASARTPKPPIARFAYGRRSVDGLS